MPFRYVARPILCSAVALWSLAATGADGPRLPAPTQAPSPQPAPATPAATPASGPAVLELAPVWPQLLKALVAEAIGDGYEDTKNWGRTREVIGGVDIEPRPGRFAPRISKHKIEVRDGFWRRYRVDLLDPERDLDVRIDNLQAVAPGVTDFTIHIALRARITAQVEHWIRGVKGFNAEVISDAGIVVDAACRITIRSEFVPGSFLPDVVLEPEVREIKARLTDLDTHQIGRLRGDLVEEIGNGSRRVIDELLQRREDQLVAKANRKIAENRDKLRFSPGSGWKK